MSVQVDKAGERHEAIRVDHRGSRSTQTRPHLDDDALANQEVNSSAVHDSGAANDQRLSHARPSRSPESKRYSTAILTETPFDTCSSTVDAFESAAPDEISSPRFIGP